MRQAYLVCYDISDDKRLRKIARMMRGYGDRVQYSVFRVIAGDRERVEMQAPIEKTMSATEDHVLIVDLGPAEGRGANRQSPDASPLPESPRAKSADPWRATPQNLPVCFRI